MVVAPWFPSGCLTEECEAFVVGVGLYSRYTVTYEVARLSWAADKTTTRKVLFLVSPTLVIVLIAVVWLFVFAPWLLRGQRPISKAGEAFDETRVVYSGGSGELPCRKRPKLTPQDIHAGREDTESLEMVTAEPVEDDALIDDDSARRVDSAMETVKSKLGKKQDAHTKDVEANVVDGEVVAELPQPDPAPVGEATAEVEDLDEYSQPYELNDAFVSPGDLLYPGEEDPVVEAEVAEEAAEPEITDSKELTDEDLEFAARRAHRGGWDPEADAQASTDRYQRRTRTLIGLAVAALVAVVFGFVVGGWAWALPAVVIVFAGVYMVALRRQVQAEERLRARRIAQLRRARLGVRNKNDEQLGIPQRLRRPGAVVLELDDDSPDFEELDVATGPVIRDPRGEIDTDSRRVS